MKKTLFLLPILLLFFGRIFAQSDLPDSTESVTSVQLGEVIVVSKPLINQQRQAKPLSTLEEYLEKSSKINLVRRGNYAWEPMINNMSTERIAVTIDGMHIFGACTDKMDPITSYVDVSNLSQVEISSGQQGASNGPTIGGSVDLIRTLHSFCDLGWSGSVDVGFESNAKLNTYGANLKYVHSKVFVDVDFMYRNASDYKAGKNIKVPFSQFTKYNISSTIGVKLNEKNTLVGSFIFDNANDIGYPALPMDVSNAKAVIASLQHSAERINDIITQWDTKIYYNNIVHVMDDTKRPVVPIHMDMPGWSSTLGAYSKMKISKNKHDISINLTGYYNKSKAEMTMYPVDKTEKSMFMYTWPDVRTVYAGLSFNDKISWKNMHSLSFSASAGLNYNKVASEVGLNSLRIFYPEMKATKVRFIPSLQVDYSLSKKSITWTTGLGYGERAPSVSEGYGFYLFNSFDRYDYVGNPFLKNEKSIELHTEISYKHEKVKLNFGTNYFHIFDYIIGAPISSLIPMTIGASGVREYKALKAADISNTEFSIEYRPHKYFKTKAAITYSYGKDYKRENLPLIRPFSFRWNAIFNIKSFSTEVSVEGASKQKDFSEKFGEDLTPAYAIVNFSAGYVFLIKKNYQINLRAGIENIANTYYSTFSDWNNIPRKGRNFYVNVSFGFDQLRKKANR